MANVLTGDWLSAPTKKLSLFARLVRAQMESRQRRVDRVVAAYLANHAHKMTDAEREIERLVFKIGR